MLRKDFFLSKYLNKNCYISNNILDFRKILKNKELHKNLFLTFKLKKKLSPFYTKRKKLVFISSLYLFRYNLSHNKRVKTDKNLIFKKANLRDWARIRKIIPKTGTSRIFHDKKIKKSLRVNYLKTWIKNFFNGLRGDSLIICEDLKKSILGLALLKKDKSLTIVDQLLVSKKAQGKGIGSQLLKVINSRYSRKPSISGVHSINKGGIDFYYSKLKCKIIKKYFYYHFHI